MDPLPKKEEEEFELGDNVISVKLDAIGWEKVFVDVRQCIPGISLPFMRRQNSRDKWNDFIQSKVLDNNKTTTTKQPEKDDVVVNVESRELYDQMKGSDCFVVPIGHQVMVVNSQNGIYSSFSKTGCPVMDHLAKQIVKMLYCGD